MLDRLWLRLLLAMSLVLALAVGAVALLVNRATSQRDSSKLTIRAASSPAAAAHSR